jgi:TolB-like protein/DNA-binding winged helix-turn-helix (wHTH) protein/Flp pilus assembly protein TadD
MVTKVSSIIYEFDNFCVDAGRRLLLNGGDEPIALTPKIFDTLLYLVSHSGQVIEKDELMSSIWPDTIVEENNLNKNISVLRHVLGENPGEHRYIVTVPGKGYKFVASVVETPRLILEERTVSNLVIAAEFAAAPPLAKIASPFSLRQRPAVILVAFGFLALTLAGVGLYLRFKPRPRVESLVVLPFSADPQTEYLADGLTESLINDLSRFSNLRVTARTWAFNYKGKEVNPRQLGQELNVSAALTGKVVLRDDILTVQVDMVDTATGAQMWGQRYHRKLSDIIAVQEDIGSQIAEKLHLRLNGEKQRQLTKHHTENQQAYQLFLKGRYDWDKDTPASRQKAVASFEQAVAEDRRYALACSWLAVAYIHLGTNGELSPHEAKTKAQNYALQAVELDETQDLAHYALGAVKLFYEWDAVGAEREFKRAIDLNPNNVDGRLAYAYYLLFVGRTEEAVAEVIRGQQLDPLALLLKTSAASMLYYARRYDEAIAQCRNALELDPNFSSAHYWLALPYLETSRPAEAIAEMKQWIRLSGRSEKYSPDLAYLYAVSSRQIEARRILRSLLADQTDADPFDNARIHFALGDKDQAFAWLEKAYEKHSMGMMWLKVNPEFDGLRADPRFHDLLRRVGHTP